jgi:RNA polymerase sigma-70 factor, ECF subfamily
MCFEQFGHNSSKRRRAFVAGLDLIRHNTKQVGSKAVSITSIYDERSKRARSAAVDHAAGQYALSAPKAPDSDLSATVAKLRSFSLLLCLNADLADRMVEITLLRVGVCMSPSRLGSNTLGWLCGRLRSYFYSEFAGRPTHATLESSNLPPVLSQFQGAAQDLVSVLTELPAEHREALVLTEAMGFSRAQAARIASCPLHIFKPRIEAARAHLAMFLSVRALRAIHDDMARFTVPTRYLHLGLA